MYNSPSFFRRLVLPLLFTLFCLAANGPAWAQEVSLQTVYSFGPAPDGTAPEAAMIQATDGNFYGTTESGGTNGTGTVFRYDPFTGDYTILHSFSATDPASNTNADGAEPYASLIQGQDGNFYGTAAAGGAAVAGTIFKIAADGTFTTLHSFNGTDGFAPFAPLLQTADGTFYGTTSGVSTYSGTLFKMTADGTVTLLHGFSGENDGGSPHALVQGTDGNLYGTTASGGSNGYGTVFQATTGGTVTTLHAFTNTDGTDPEAGLVQGTDGNFYGTTQQGGVNSNGTVFKITPTGTLTTLYQFAGGQPGATDGSNPFSNLVQGPDGNFYGTTYAGGGATEYGTIYEITPAGTLTTLYRFTGGNDGAAPYAALTLDRRGDFFGVATNGGANNGGTIFLLNAHGILSFGATACNVSENAGSVTLVVNRTGGGTGAVGVTYTAEDGTAVAGTDYTATTGTLSWADSDLSPKTITVPIVDRKLYDGSTRVFDVYLSLPTGGAVLQAAGQETVTINENDTAPTQPTITLDSPTDDTETLLIGSTLTIAAHVTDPDGVLASVQFTVNGATVGTANAAGPYVFTGLTPTAAGTYTVGAVATDSLGRVNASTHTITVTQGSASDPVPSATILTALDGLEVGVGQTIPISATASTSTGDALAKVNFYAGGVLIASFSGSGAPIPTSGVTPAHPPRRADAAAPVAPGTVFQTTYQVPGGSKLVNLLVVAFTKLGVVSVSNAATIHPVDPTVGNPPTVGLSGLADGATIPVGVPATVGVDVTLPAGTNAVSVRAPNGVHRQDAASQLADLAFFLNASLLQQGIKDASNPGFTFTPPAAGDYVVEAIATATDGLSGVAMPILVHAVAVSAPTVVTLAMSGDDRAQFGSENGKVVVRRTGDVTGALMVSYRTKGSAKAGVDFKTLPGTITIPPGAAQAKIKLKPLHNASNTGTLKAKLVLLPPTDGSYELGNTTVIKVRVVGGL